MKLRTLEKILNASDFQREAIKKVCQKMPDVEIVDGADCKARPELLEKNKDGDTVFKGETAILAEFLLVMTTQKGMELAEELAEASKQC